MEETVAKKPGKRREYRDFTRVLSTEGMAGRFLLFPDCRALVEAVGGRVIQRGGGMGVAYGREGVDFLVVCALADRRPSGEVARGTDANLV